LAESRFPLWAFITEMAAVPVAIILFWLLLRRLRLVHLAQWEKLGRPTLLVWTWPGSITELLDRVAANFRLLMFPFRTQSFQLGDPIAATFLWLLRATLGLLATLRLWSWWANP
jgi:hypothetical protein